MKSARSMMKLLMCGVGVAAMVSSCTIESGDDDETGGTANATGGTSVMTGGASGTTGGASGTTGGTANTSGGTAMTSGGNVTTTGGAGGSDAGGAGGTGGEAVGGEAVGGAGGNPSGQGGGGASNGGGQAGQGGQSFDDCDTCLDSKCTAELDACLDDPDCISEGVDGSGEYEQIIECVDMARTMRAVKRIDLRNCGTATGTGLDWPPLGMSEATRNLVNCMATGDTGEAMNDSWANSQNISNAWAANSCAKLACTSQL